MQVFATPADIVKNRALFDKEAAAWPREYYAFAADALEMVGDFVRGVRCLDSLLLHSVHARGVELAVPFAQLAEFKVAAKRRARWCAVRRKWVLGALQPAAGLERWGAVGGEGAWAAPCGRCSVCERGGGKRGR